LSLLQNAFHCRGPLQTLWSSRRQQQHDARVRNRSVEGLLKVRTVTLIQRDERRLTGRSGTRSPKMKPDRHNRNCHEQPERLFSCHEFLPCQPVCDELRKYGHKGDHSYCDPELRHAEGTTPGAALLSSAIYLPELQHEQ
jgi:hypothetical protein